MTGYQELACAVVEKAIFDYRKALRLLKRDMDNLIVCKQVDELENFFKSEWFTTLSNVDGLFVIDTVCEQELFNG